MEHHAVLLETTGAGFILFLTYGIIFLDWKKSLLGALGGLLITLAFYFLGILVSKIVGAIRKKKLSEVAFGLGDVMAATIFGLLVGWPAIVGVIIIAIVSFALVIRDHPDYPHPNQNTAHSLMRCRLLPS